MLLLIHGKSFEFSTWLTREILIWLENSTQGISNSEDFHYLHWRLVADYPGHVTTHFRTQCQRPVHLKDLICDISHSMKIKYPYTKPQSPTLFISKSHPSHFCTKLWSKTICVQIEIALINLQSSVIELESSLIQYKSSLIRPTRLQYGKNIGIRYFSNSITDISNRIRELSNSIMDKLN